MCGYIVSYLHAAGAICRRLDALACPPVFLVCSLCHRECCDNPQCFTAAPAALAAGAASCSATPTMSRMCRFRTHEDDVEMQAEDERAELAVLSMIADNKDWTPLPRLGACC